MSEPLFKPMGSPRERYRGKLLRVVEQDVQFADGSVKTFERSERPPGVRILAVNRKNEMLLTKEWRAEQSGFDLRLPGGKVFDSASDFIEHTEGLRRISDLAQLAAARELMEETSLKVNVEQLHEYHRSVCGATVVWDLLYYTVHVRDAPTEFERIETHEGEVVQPMWMSLANVKHACLNGEIKEDRTVAVLLRFAMSQVSNG